jgi:hypothetical protein
MSLRFRWPCVLLLLVTLADLFLLDPLPFLDEAVLAALTAECFRRHRAPPAG